ncbi:MAG TPA: hypothetical protein DIC60_03715 [Lachnospiraceae bacterium]|nr:hypothetical protein [Lachnospiraceae bacterium]
MSITDIFFFGKISVMFQNKNLQYSHKFVDRTWYKVLQLIRGDKMFSLYVGCLAFGLFYSLISMFLGDHHGFDHSSTDHGGEVGTDGIEHISPFKPIVIGSFITVFGGMGVIGHYIFNIAALFLFVIALVSGLVVATIIFYVVVVTMYKNQGNSIISVQDLKRTIGDVITPIPANGVGEISYTTADSIYKSTARSLDGEEIAKGEKVIIVDYNDNIATVVKKPEINL